MVRVGDRGFLEKSTLSRDFTYKKCIGDMYVSFGTAGDTIASTVHSKQQIADLNADLSSINDIRVFHPSPTMSARSILDSTFGPLKSHI
jgi:diphthamide biosynthesis methyltransferase